jgi:hypothetical protein
MIISNLLAKPQKETAFRAILAMKKAVKMTLVAHTGYAIRRSTSHFTFK